MWRALPLVLLAGCADRSDDGTWGADPGTGSTGASSGAYCSADDPCASNLLCARNNVCASPDQLRAIHANWTVSGARASDTSCASSPDLVIEFHASSPPGRLAFAPVPCSAGRYTIDLLPRSFDFVVLGRALGSGSRPGATVDAVTGEVTLDLPY